MSKIRGQTEIKPLIQDTDHEKWHTMRFPQISGNGKWYSYWLDYEQREDTLIVASTDGKKEYDFPNAHGGQFDPSVRTSLFAFNDNEKGIGILNLNLESTEWIEEADRFEFSKNGKYLACFSLKKHNGFLKLIDIQKNTSKVIQGLQNFKFDPTGERAIIVMKDSIIGTRIELLGLNKMHSTIILSKENSEFLYPTWNESGDIFAFMENKRNSEQQIYYFDTRENLSLQKLDNIKVKEIDAITISNLSLSLSRDGERVFFWIKEDIENTKRIDQDTVGVQVWKGTDKWIYPRQHLDWEYNKQNRLAVWFPKNNTLTQIGTAERPEVRLSGDQKTAITYSLFTYEPQYKQRAHTDYYLLDLETNESKEFIQNVSTVKQYIDFSPNGKHIAYFKDKEWWVYDISNNTHSLLTNNLEVSFSPSNPFFASGYTPYGCAGWTDSNEILIYDEFDIWRIGTNGMKKERLTNGREKGIQYRFAFPPFAELGQINYEVEYKYPHRLNRDIILSNRDEFFNEGFSIRNENGKIEPFINEIGRISELRKADYTDVFLFVKENHKTPPALYQKDKRNTKILFQSNSHYKKFAFGGTELLAYKNQKKEDLKALLHYPDDYKEGKKYPMIVHIYLLFSHNLNKYVNPSRLNGDGYNYKNFTAAGYFVLEPDILLEPGNPGMAANNCVISAVNEVLNKDLVKKNSIGLIGHSFGGYETAFIISQSELFSAAVVGAGIFDIVNFYHTVGRNYGKPELWRFENEQWNMGKSFYEDPKSYYYNNPLHHTRNTRTPTLIWTGNKDYHVNWHQSEQMYLALRRINTEVELLIYEGEDHTLALPKNQNDLSLRILNWFDKHLKNKDAK